MKGPVPPRREAPARSPATREPAGATESAAAGLDAGRPLESGPRARMERALGVSFAATRVHTDGPGAARAQGVSARAFAVGEDVAFAPGEYRPGTLTGDALLAHELAHVAQQRGGPSRGTAARGDEAEWEAGAHGAAAGALFALYGGARGIEPGSLRAGAGLRLQRCSTPAPLPAIGDPRDYATYDAWLATFPPYAVSGTVRDVASALPPGMRTMIEGTHGHVPDCADVALILRHHWLSAHGKSFTFKVGPTKEKAKEFTLGAGAGDEAVRSCMIDSGSISFQEDRSGGFRVVNFYKDEGVRVTNLKRLLDKGLKGGDVIVWKRGDPNRPGHIQTVQEVDVAAKRILVLQGNMEGGAGSGEIQQKSYTFKDLTGRDDANAEVRKRDDLGFFGAGRWIE